MMDDLISRQTAVNAIRLYECDDHKINMGLIIAMNLIEKVPSAQRTGKWIDDNCSECGCYVHHGDARNYCPNCGAKMEGDANG